MSCVCIRTPLHRRGRQSSGLHCNKSKLDERARVATASRSFTIADLYRAARREIALIPAESRLIRGEVTCLQGVSGKFHH